MKFFAIKTLSRLPRLDCYKHVKYSKHIKVPINIKNGMDYVSNYNHVVVDFLLLIVVVYQIPVNYG